MIASYEAALLEMRNPGPLAIFTDPAKRVKRQKVESIEREFFELGEGAGGASAAPVLSSIEGLRAPLVPVSGPAILVV